MFTFTYLILFQWLAIVQQYVSYCVMYLTNITYITSILNFLLHVLIFVVCWFKFQTPFHILSLHL